MKKGFTLVEIMIVVAIIGLLAAIAIPSFMRARTTSQKNACINNLRQIEAAKDQYALEAGLTNLALLSFHDIGPVTSLLYAATSAGGFLKSWPLCPASTTIQADLATLASAVYEGLTSNDYNITFIGTNCHCRIVTNPAAAAHLLP